MLPNVRRQRQGVAFPVALPDHQALNMDHLPFIKLGLGVAVGLTGMRHPVIGTTV
jgi:hypothetical protein